MSPHMNTSLSSRRPSFNASTFGSPNFVDKTLSTKKIINSPFYSGRTVYGGASAYGRKLGRTELHLKSNLKNSVHIKPVNQQQDESNNLVLGKTARRILETLEQYNSPISDAKKIPMASKKAKEGLISKYIGANPYLVRETKGALHKELQVPSVTDLLKMKQKTRLQDCTEAVRQIAKTSKSDLNSESYKLATNEEEKEKHTGKLRTKISSVRPKASAHHDVLVSEVSLKPVSLPITTLPKFDIVVPPPKPVVASKPSEKPAPVAAVTPPVAPAIVPKPPQTEHSQNKNTDRFSIEYKFSDPLVIAENLKSIIAMNNFKFSKPLSKQIQDEVAASKVTLNFKMPENKLPLLIPKQTKNNGDALVKATSVLKSGSVMEVLGQKSELLTDKFKPAKDSWECNICLIRNAVDKTKCAACETPRLKKAVENKVEFGTQFKMTQDNWECTTCMVRNSNIDTKCVCCTTPKPSGSSTTSIPTASSFGDKFKPKAGTWECPVCMIQNKLELSNCAACDASNPKAPVPASGFLDKFKPATNTWECSSCMVRNKEDSTKCVACESPRNGTVKPATGFGSSFKTKEDEWECSVCMVKNKKNLSKCQCCETSRPGSLNTSEDKPSIAKFNFGIDKAAAASFSFGVPPAAQQHLPKLDVQPASVFGEAAKSTASSSVPTFSFGLPNSTEKKDPTKQEEKKETAVTNPLLRPDEKLPDKAIPAAAGFKFGLPTPATTTPKEQPKLQETPNTASDTSTTNTESKLMLNFSSSPCTTTLFGGNKSDSSPSKSDAAAAPLMFSFGSKASSTSQTTTASQPVSTQSTPVFSFSGTAAKSSTESTAPVFGASLGTPAKSTSSTTFGSTAAAENVTLFASSTSAAASSSTSSEPPPQKAAMFQFGQSASTTSAAPASATSAATTPSAGGFNFNPAAAPAAPSFNFSAASTQPTAAFNFAHSWRLQFFGSSPNF
nr:unnamed protein product [Callosobruchus analis]